MAMRSVVFVSLLLQLPLSFAQSCYWPDGTLLTPQNNQYNFTPCFDGSSQCCAAGEVCLSNGLCFSGPQGELYRGACTDKSWKTSACPQYCSEGFPDGAPNIVPCPFNSDGQSGQWQYWCGVNSSTNWCKAATNCSLFDYPTGLTVKIATTDNTTNTTCVSSNSTGRGSNESSCTSQNEANMMGLQVGAGVGIPLFVIALFLGILLLREKRTKKKLLERILQEDRATGDGRAVGPHSPLVPAMVYELDGPTGVAELPSKRTTTQLKPTNSSYS